MSTVKLVKAEDGSFTINFHNTMRGERSAGYESDLTLKKLDDQTGRWVCEMNIGDMPPQESAEAAIDRMQKYLEALSRVVKGKNIKHLNVETMFKPKSR